MQNEIKDIITSVTVENEITLVTVYSLPNSVESISQIFECLAENGVNVDMISLNPSSGVHQIVSFSANNNDLPNILSTLGLFKKTYSDLRIDVNSNNCKFTFAGDAMRDICGVAAFVFTAFATKKINIKLITTSETKISCLIDEVYYSSACDMIGDTFGLQNL